MKSIGTMNVRIAIALAALAGCYSDGVQGGGETPPPTCEEVGLASCMGVAVCVDTRTDKAHCGACDNACGEDRVCRNGECVVSCGAGKVKCGETCTNTDTDAKNCGGCGLRCSATHTKVAPTCADGICQIECADGYGDCDGKSANGCEAATTSDYHCGGCGMACSNVKPGSQCIVEMGAANCRCPAYLTECTGRCVDVQSDPRNCGACGKSCEAGYVCRQGACARDCGALTKCANDSCADLKTDPMNCGACGNTCNPANGSGQCNGGRCMITACNRGFADCDGSPANGCEVNIETDVANCGACRLRCPKVNGVPVCVDGQCEVGQCNPGFGDCDANPANGCEINLLTNTNHCSACGNVCSLPNATSTCGQGACKVSQCNAGWADCDGNAQNGCEVNLLNTPQSCGACGNTCVTPNGVPGCAAGNCTTKSCNLGFADCNGERADGCEVDKTSDPKNCGGCNIVCPQNTPTCDAGRCVASCKNGKIDGRETDIDCGGGTCGGCQIGQSCAVDFDCASKHCVGWVCSPEPTCSDRIRIAPETDVDCGGPSCQPCADGMVCKGSSDCLSGVCKNLRCVAPSCLDGVKNGQETDVDCGGNCQPCEDWRACKSPADCKSGVCVEGVCRAATCSDKVKNGLETDVDCGGNCQGCALGQFCGGKDENCAELFHGYAICIVKVPNSPSTCQFNYCHWPWGNCDGNVGNGCETNMNNNQNCGGCGVICNAPNSAQYCDYGACAIASCTYGFDDCDKRSNNGCETSILTDVKNCGACGRICNGKCDQGSCVMSCNDGIKNNQESDVDCGGPTCGKCVNGRTCQVNSDCVSGNCAAGRCAPVVEPPMDGGVSDGGSVDMVVKDGGVDGGPVDGGSDMGSDMMRGDMAVPAGPDNKGKTPLGASGANGGQEADGTNDHFDDDGDGYCEVAPCIGSIDPTRSVASLKGGDCDDAVEVKNLMVMTSDGKSLLATDGSYWNRPDGSEWCDGFDNDCNGVVDNACK